VFGPHQVVWTTWHNEVTLLERQHVCGHRIQLLHKIWKSSEIFYSYISSIC